MNTVFIDTNVILDLILEREGVDDAARILQMGVDGFIVPTVSILTMANTAYVYKKGRTTDDVRKQLRNLASLVTTLPMDEEQLLDAIDTAAPDFEDVLQYQCAEQNGCDVIVTDNVKHFRFSKKIPVLSPSEYIAQWSGSGSLDAS